jgi:nitroreductase
METLAIVGDKATVTGRASIGCGHCEAVCPCGAIDVSSLDDETIRFHTFTPDREWLPYGRHDLAGLVRLMASRRSCRNYLDRPVERSMLEDLVRIGITAPSGTNSQAWTFTLVPTRKAVVALALPIGTFFRGLNRKAANPLVRLGLKLVGKPELDHYYRTYKWQVEEALDEWDRTGRDRLFHGAPAVIVIGSRPGGTTPAEDALLAAQNILLASHGMGLGTCLIGYAVAAMKADRSIQQAIGMAAQEDVHAVIAIGHPDETYATVCRRRLPAVRYFEG